MSWKIPGLIGVLFAALLAVPSTADASTLLCTSYASCRDAGMSDRGYQDNQGNSYWNMYTGTNCTNYAAYRLVATNGMPNVRPKSGVGNARDWGSTMASITDDRPVVGSIAWWGRASGGNHVAYVERVVSADEIIISESNYGRAFDWRRVTSGSGWPDGFIHFADPKLVASKKPTISGTKRVGSVLTASTGSWKPAPSSYAYQWFSGGKAVSGATDQTFTPRASDLAGKVTVKVTARRASFPAAAATSSAVTVAAGRFTTSVPTVTGSPTVDSTLTAARASWSPVAKRTTYQWFADGQAIDGATGKTLTLAPDQVDQTITVAIEGTRPGYTTASTQSAETTAVAPGTMSVVKQPVVTGTPRVDATLKASGGEWDKPGVSVAWQWLRDGVAIDGATRSTYQATPADAHHRVSVRATATKHGYVPSVTTVDAGEVVRATFTQTKETSVSGSPQVGRDLTVTPGTWTPEPTRTAVQWYVDGQAVKGATGLTFTPRPDDLGLPVKVVVKVVRDGYTSASSNTAVGEVAPGTMRFTRRVTVKGTPLLGTVLTADPSLAGLPEGTTFTYRWLRDGEVISRRTRSTYTVQAADLGHRVDVEVTASAPGYTPVSSTSATKALARSTSTVGVKATGGRRTATFSIHVTAPSVSPVSGRVSVTIGTVVHSVELRKGRATIRLVDLARGAKQKVTVRYSGSDTTTTGSATTTVTIT